MGFFRNFDELWPAYVVCRVREKVPAPYTWSPTECRVLRTKAVFRIPRGFGGPLCRRVVALTEIQRAVEKLKSGLIAPFPKSSGRW